MKNYLLLLLVIISLSACNSSQPESAHQASQENFTVNRFIILNENDEMLMAKEQWVWAPPSALFKQRQYLKEQMDSVANAYGIQISTPELRGQFSFKYDYQPYATIRNYYVAKYVSGTLKVPEPMNEAVWMKSSEAIEKNTVTAIKQITQQLMKYPNVVWGGSFMVSHEGDDHPTKQVEDFYPLFGKMGE